MTQPIPRRTALIAAAGLAAAPLAGAKPKRRSKAAKAKTFVLVHGTWLGGWLWTPVVERLTAMGHRAFAPTMTGLGERAHLISPAIGLDTHARDVCGVIEAEELSEVILVGHSFAGVTITEAADRMRDRISRLVFFDALIPTRAKPAAINPGPDGQYADTWRQRIPKFIDGYKMDFFAEYEIEMICPGADRLEIRDRIRRGIRPHPAKQWTDPASFARGGWEGLARTYIQCTEQTYRPSSPNMWGEAKKPGWDWIDYPASRAGMLTKPDMTADLLAGL
jgi:pimeloyl-ACP methyl ester carboxylesterase